MNNGLSFHVPFAKKRSKLHQSNDNVSQKIVRRYYATFDVVGKLKRRKNEAKGD